MEAHSTRTRIRPPGRPAVADVRRAVTRLPIGLLLALPGALVVYTGFDAGGFFASTQGILGVLLAVVLVLWVLMADDPLAGASVPLAVAAGALSLLAIWTLASSSWSHAPGRAVLEFDRMLVYLLVLLLFGTLPITRQRLRWIVRGMVLGALVVCVAGLVSRVLPEVLPTSPNGINLRLSYPITYWNALGLLGSLAFILTVHLASSEHEPRLVRVLAAGAAPLLASTVFLTFSRGAIGAGILGLLAYLAYGRPRLVVAGALTTLAAAAVGVLAAYRAPALAGTEPAGPLAVAQGHRVAVALLLCTGGAMAARALLLRFDARILRRAPRRLRLRTSAAIAACGVAFAAAAFLLAGGPSFIARQYDTFAQRGLTGDPTDLRARLTNPSSNGRIDKWDVDLRAFRAARLHGQGAGTFELQWNRHRPYSEPVFDGHSVYLEFLAELGVVGFGLLMVVLVTLVVGVARRARGPDRALFAALLAVLGAWALRAGADWDWEMPVLTLWVFVLAPAALAVPTGSSPPAQPEYRSVTRPVRLIVALGILVMAVTPARAALSQIRLNRAVQAFDQRDCAKAIDASLGSIEALGSRPEPHMLVAFCDARQGETQLAVRAMTEAVELDPGAWEYHYGLALVRGVGGMDPLPEARRASRLNPREARARRAVQAFSTRDPRQWRRVALDARLPTG